MSDGSPPEDGSGDGPVTERGRRTARSLRQAARGVFGEHGYADARVADVVDAAGVSHGTFYTYYDNKAAVLDALVDETAARLLQVVSEPWQGPDAPATVAGVLDRFIDVLADEADVIAAWIQATAHEAHFRERLREVRQGYTDRVAEQLEPYLADTDHDPSVVAAALVALVEGYATQGLDEASVPERERAVDTLTSIWIGGVRELSSG